MFAKLETLGTLLFDQQTGVLLACDLSASSGQMLYQITPGQSKLRDLLPNLTAVDCVAIANRTDPESHEIETELALASGDKHPVLVRLQSLMGSDQDYLLVFLQLFPRQGVTEAQCDALTGLPDRRQLQSRVHRWQQAAGEKDYAYAVLFVDLDQFKRINDRHGHAVGDQVLIRIAARLKSCVRERDLVVRYGGDEFVILLAGFRNRHEVRPVINRIASTAAEPILIDDQEFRVGATIGVAIFGESTEDLQELIKLADRDMYDSKSRS